MNSAPQRDMPQVPFLWTRGVAVRETLNYFDKSGVDAEPILSKAELSRRQLQQDLGGVSVASQHRFLDLAANQTNDPLLGLHVAAEIRPARDRDPLLSRSRIGDGVGSA